MNCPQCNTPLSKTLDGHDYELTDGEVEFAKAVSPFPTSPDIMRMKAAMFELKCGQCHTSYTLCLCCKRLVPQGELHRVTKKKWEVVGDHLTQLDGVYSEYYRCSFCGYSVGGYRERYTGENDGDHEPEFI